MQALSNLFLLLFYLYCFFSIFDVKSSKMAIVKDEIVNVEVQGFEEFDKKFQNVVDTRKAYYKAVRELMDFELLFNIGKEYFRLDKQKKSK